MPAHRKPDSSVDFRVEMAASLRLGGSFMDKAAYPGVHTALVTPLLDGKVDWESTEKLVEEQIRGGVSGLVAVGTTGESPTLDHTEHIEFIRFVVKKAAGRVPVIAGTGANSTAEAVCLVREADKVGADAHLQVAPYYNKPSQDGLFAHFSSVAEATERPIILYSIPGRCVIEIGVETCARLRDAHANVTAIKEAGGKVDRILDLRHRLGEDFHLLSGDDSLTLPFMISGACGVISVASNLLPERVSAFVKLALEGRLAEASAEHIALYPLFRDLFIEPNPVPVKWAMARADLLRSAEVRLPLSPLSQAAQAQLLATLENLETTAGA